MPKFSTVLQRAESLRKYENSLTKCSKCTKPVVCEENLLAIRAAIGIESEPEINGSEASRLLHLGFGPVGVRRYSKAAKWQSMLGNVESGSQFATFQSLGAKGLNTLFFGGTTAALSLLKTVSSNLNWCHCSRPEVVLKDDVENKSTLKFHVINRSRAEYSPATVRLTIDNVARLMFLETPNFTLGSSTWSVKVFRKNPNHFGISFMGDRSSKLIIKISVLGITKPIRKTYNQNIKAAESFIINEFTSWNELLKHENGFIRNDSITIEIKIRIDANVKPLRLVCFICSEGIGRQAISSLSCGHLFCSKCIRESLIEKKDCPKCHQPATLNDLRRTILPV